MYNIWFSEPHSGPLDDAPEGYIEKIPGFSNSETPIINKGIDKVQFKCNCFNGPIANGIIEPVLFFLPLINLQVIKYTKK